MAAPGTNKVRRLDSHLHVWAPKGSQEYPFYGPTIGAPPGDEQLIPGHLEVLLPNMQVSCPEKVRSEKRGDVQRDVQNVRHCLHLVPRLSRCGFYLPHCSTLPVKTPLWSGGGGQKLPTCEHYQNAC